jgi:hypothetical protein
VSDRFVRVRTENMMETSMSRAYAEAAGVEILDGEDAVDVRGRPLPVTRKGGRRVLPRTSVNQEAARRAAAESPAELKGEALDIALTDAGLAKTGSADEKRQRLADHQAGLSADDTPEEASE